MPCAPKMAGCRASCLHRALIARYRDERAVALQDRLERREAATLGYATEGAAWDEVEGPMWQLREFLINNRRQDEPEPVESST